MPDLREAPVDQQTAAGGSAPEAPAATPAAQAQPTVQEIDRALADDLDTLLQGDFESVDEILEGVFGEKASLVDAPAASEPVPAEPTPAPAPASEPAPGEPEPASEAAPEVAGPVEEPTEIAPAPEAAPVAAKADAAGSSGEPAAPEDEPHPQPALEPEPSAAMEPPPEPAAPESPPDAAASAPETSRPDPASIGRRARSGLVLALTVVNKPLRMVPAPLRPAVDWIALTLAFWVPIVWAFAMFVVGEG